MNREIKFRAWNQFTKSFYDEAFLISKNGIPFIYNKEYLHTEEFDAVNPVMGLIIQQYTGFKDKNGKEMYEGDIVKFLNRTHCKYSVVTYSEYDAAFKIEDRFIREISKLNDIIIISNIFENPDLLK